MLGLLLRRRVRTQVAVGGPVQADVELAAQTLDGRAAGANAVAVVQVLSQFLVGPVGPIQPLLGRPFDHPAAELLRQGRRDLGSGTGRLVWAEAIRPPFEVGIKPALDGAGTHPQLVGDSLALLSLVGESDDVESVAEFGVGGGAEGPLQTLGLSFAELNVDHSW